MGLVWRPNDIDSREHITRSLYTAYLLWVSPTSSSILKTMNTELQLERRSVSVKLDVSPK